jgi:hypothetical protein
VILTLRRFASLADETLGAVHVDGRFCCFSLEDEHRDLKVAGETRIPAGHYPLKLRTVGRLHEKYSGKFTDHRGMLELVGVPGFDAVLIHIGNTERDTAGCILVGDGAIATGELTLSVQAYRRLYAQCSNALLAGEPVSIHVED